jgi:signal transduction histidine kinase
VTIGGIRIELEEHDLVVLVSDIVRELQPELDRFGSTVVWNVPNRPAIGRWDRRRLSLAIRNLLSNAIKFAPGTPIEVSVYAAPAEMRLAIKDQGPGLSPEDQARIFERYHRPAPIRHYGGFGLGLWIVRRVAEEHGGRVEVRSELGKGAEFTLVLPRQPALVTADRPFTSEGHHDGP